MKNLFQKKHFLDCLHNSFIVVLFVLVLQIPVGCKKEKAFEIAIPIFDSIVDVENNSYKIVKIGNQWWMAENLKVKSFSDGTLIRNAESDMNWKEELAGFSLYRNDVNSPGLLYNWFAVNDVRKIAPAGWHVATESDWQNLETFLGMNNEVLEKMGWRGTKEGSKLKVFGREGWSTEVENWPTNESGFSALAGGCRKQNGIWGDPGLFQAGFWWTASDYKEGKAYYRHLDYKKSQIFRHYDYKNCGMSVRCVKD
jgi:uncharacterized protein (TIGR02145 family)